MRLGDLVDDAMAAAGSAGWAVVGDGDVEISSVGLDSRAVTPGALFFAVRGGTHDGHAFVTEAVAQGARAVVVERLLDVDVAQVVVPEVRQAMPWLAAVFAGQPSLHLSLIGVTGTNGKTSVVSMVGDLLAQLGDRSATIGTLTGARTTPDAPELQSQLAAFVGAGVEAVAMEVSSHALDQGRVTGLHFRVGVFTNLSPDHLDYHGTMDAYFAAKARLFERDRCRAAVIGTDTEWGRRLAATIDVPTVQVDTPPHELALTGSRFTWRGHAIRLPLPGTFNVTNACLAAEAVVAAGHDVAATAAALDRVSPVPGRFEVLATPGRPTVVVDYAHTPDGLDNLLRSVRRLTAGRVVVVFGCGGDRDREKRPLMGRVVDELADLAIVTSDNPRSEPPEAIAAEIVSAMSDPVVELDRTSAIAAAIARAEPDDVVVVAGKGHEKTQTIGDQVLPFDDRDVVRRLLEGDPA